MRVLEHLDGAPDLSGYPSLEAALEAHGVHDSRLMAAIAKVPEALFAHPAHDGGGAVRLPQLIVHAKMIEALELRGDEKVLDVGASLGYRAALLAELARHVVAIEIRAERARRARENLGSLGVRNVEVIHADGHLGWPAGAPYDAIVVAAAVPEIPKMLASQLVDGGRLVIALGGRGSQVLVRCTQRGSELARELLGHCDFVPLARADD